MGWTPGNWAAVWAGRLSRAADVPQGLSRFRQSLESNKPALRAAMQDDLLALIEETARSMNAEDQQRLISHLTVFAERDTTNARQPPVMVGESRFFSRLSRRRLARAVVAGTALGLFLWACAANPLGALEAACERAIASADEIVVSTGGMAFPTQTFLLRGPKKDDFAREMSKLLAVESKSVVWSGEGESAVARPGGSVAVMRDGLCAKRIVFHTSLRLRDDAAMNRPMGRLRSIASEGQSVLEGSEPACPFMERDGIYWWFGLPRKYEYVLRPYTSP